MLSESDIGFGPVEVGKADRSVAADRDSAASGTVQRLSNKPDSGDRRDGRSRKRRESNWTILMARAQGGDAEAYLELLREITPYIRFRASRFFRDPCDVEDTVQDCLLTIHSVRHTYDSARPFGPWLVAIANRRSFDRLRHRKRRQIHEVPLTNAHDGSVSETDRRECQADIDWLNGAIEKLPRVQQQAIRLLKLKEMSLQEAASSTGTSIASLKVATFRALNSLRRRVDVVELT
jgi:RNA polymerase sigma factor (sigma-70 family)